MCTGEFALGLKPAATTMYLAYDDLVTRGLAPNLNLTTKRHSAVAFVAWNCVHNKAGEVRAIMLVRAQV